MSLPVQPRLRRVESFPVSQPNGEVVFAMRDPEGFSPSIVLHYSAAVLVSLMDGSRTTAEIQSAFQEKTGEAVSNEELAQLLDQLDQRWFMDTDRFRSRWKREVEIYLNSPSRPSAHAGKAYPADPEALRAQIASFFSGAGAGGAPAERPPAEAVRQLRGLMSPHIDFQRGGPAFASAYQRLLTESDADLFVIFGTAHNPMRSLFSVTKKHFDTPLGTVETDRAFVAKLAANLKSAPGGADTNLFADELAHRQEH